MGKRFETWHARSQSTPTSWESLRNILLANRQFRPAADLDFGDHGLDRVADRMALAIERNERIALYADYDVDGTMSCVSWIWFLRALGYRNFVHYIPCRFKEGYGVHLSAIEHLISTERAQVIITMDTGITANEEARYCRQHGVEFICTDHHKIQPDRMPDCMIMNPKLHPDPEYQELCGCGVTFVLLRKLGRRFSVPADLWQDLLALTGMATICDVVPLNGVNHHLARLGTRALLQSHRTVLVELRRACALSLGIDEKDVGFRLGPRINAVGRLDHADAVVRAFIEEDPRPLIEHMDLCNNERKKIQGQIVDEARSAADSQRDLPVLFLGGDWHHGVVGIAASRMAEEFWRPTWLFQRGDLICKGSARSIPGFDVTAAMVDCREVWTKFGGHRAAGGFTFERAREDEVRDRLVQVASARRYQEPHLWRSTLAYDCTLPAEMLSLSLLDVLDPLRPYGHGFEEPRFCIKGQIGAIDFYRDRDTGAPRHTVVTLAGGHTSGPREKIKFFNHVETSLEPGQSVRFIVSAERNTFRGRTTLSLLGHDWEA